MSTLEQFRDGEDRRAFAGDFEKGVGHSAFEHQTGVEHHVGLKKLRHVVARGLVEVRINTLTHQAEDSGLVTGDALHEVLHHRDGGDDGVGPGQFLGRGGTRGGDEQAGQGDSGKPGGEEWVGVSFHG